MARESFENLYHSRELRAAIRLEDMYCQVAASGGLRRFLAPVHSVRDSRPRW